MANLIIDFVYEKWVILNYIMATTCYFLWDDSNACFCQTNTSSSIFKSWLRSTGRSCRSTRTHHSVLRDNLRDTEVDYMYIVRKLCIQKFHFFNEVSIFIFNVQNGGNKRKTWNMIINIESIWLYCKKFWMYRSPYTCIPACSVHGSLTQQIQKPCTSINS
jgi:hypothetical protein